MSENDARKRLANSIGLLQRSHLIIPLSLLALSILCATLIFADSRSRSRSSQLEATPPVSGPRIIPLPKSQHLIGTYLEVRIDTGGRNDLFYCTIVPTTTCSPLTQSPAVDEMWPVLDANGNHVAYYAQGEESTEVALLTLPPTSTLSAGTQISVIITVLTEQAGTSGLHIDYQVSPTNAPVFSPDGKWVAFPVQATKGETSELFIARIDGRNVRQVTDKGWMIKEYVWVTKDAILMTFQRPNGKLQQWRAILSVDNVTLEKIP